MYLFETILREHQKRYPLMLAQDYGKLAYQSAFGPAHLASDKESFTANLMAEWETASMSSFSQSLEPIGNSLCRFHLTDRFDPAKAAPLIADLLQLTIKEHHGTEEKFADKLFLLEALNVPCMKDWLMKYRAQGCPLVRHSRVFREAYQPHYRLLKYEYAGYFPLLLQISALAECGAPAIVAIDGRCGSGKTALSGLLQRLFACNVLHMDDFYLPFSKRAPDWEQIPGGNMDFERFLREILMPAKAGKAICYRPFDCQTGQMLKTALLPPRMLTVVEGSYSQHPLLAGLYKLKIFLTCSKEEQTRRLQTREGSGYDAFENRWIPMEEQYFNNCGVEKNTAISLDTSDFWRL